MKQIVFVAQVMAVILFNKISLLAQQVEKTDTSIVRIVNPRQDLKLWYGSDDFRVDNFVVLPEYTLLYNKNLSTFRLLSNQAMLVQDTYKLLSIRSIKPHIVDNKKHAIGALDPWFTVLNDSTVLAGTAPFKGRKAVSGYVKIVIAQAKLYIEHIPFLIDEKADNVDASRTQFITNCIYYKGGSVFVSYIPLNKTDGYVFNGSVYVKSLQKELALLYETPLIEKKEVNAIQLLSIDGKLLIYDPTTEQVRIATTDLGALTLIDLSKIIPAGLLSGKRSFRHFLLDRINKQLYYRIAYFDKGVSDQLYMKVLLSTDSLTAEPILRTAMMGFRGFYVNNRRLFFYDEARGYIYVTKAGIP